MQFRRQKVVIICKMKKQVVTNFDEELKVELGLFELELWTRLSCKMSK